MQILIKRPGEYPEAMEVQSIKEARTLLGNRAYEHRDMAHIIMTEPEPEGEINVVNLGIGDVYGTMLVISRHGDEPYDRADRNIHNWCGALNRAKDEMRRLKARDTVL